MTIAACLTLGASAALGATQPMPFSQLSPADGLQHTASSYPQATDAEMIEFFIDTNVQLCIGVLELEVATQNVQGQNGTLADDYQVYWTTLSKSDAYPTQYRHRTRTYYQWPAIPGTYYWQISGVANSDCSTRYVTPVRTITIVARPQPPPTGTPRPTTPPPPTFTPPPSDTDRAPALSASRAKRYAAAALREKFGRSYRKGQHRKIACRSRISRLRRSCKVSWRYKTWRYRGKVTVWHTNYDWRDSFYSSLRILRIGNPCESKGCRRVYSG
jgi:hypothetical protein